MIDESELEKIERCPSCGAWTYWPSIGEYLTAEFHPERCHHETKGDRS